VLTRKAKEGLVVEFALGKLRPLMPADVHSGYVSGLNDPEVNRYLVNVRTTEQTTAGVTCYVEQNLEAGDAVLFGIWVGADARHCGTVRLHGIGATRGRAHIGVCIFDRARWRRGVGAAAIEAVSRWGCASLPIDTIEAGVYADNAASERAFTAAGYVRRQTIANVFERDGHPAPVHIYEFCGGRDGTVPT
jgi:[ribosomal protein S5]-alanine N-acetyltransferase